MVANPVECASKIIWYMARKLRLAHEQVQQTLEISD